MSEIELKRRSKFSLHGHLLAKNLFGSACSGQYFMSVIELKGGQSSACNGHLLAKNLFGSACSGQYFMSEIELKRRSKFCLPWSFGG